MELVLEPKKELIERAENLGFNKEKNLDYYMDRDSTMALLVGKKMFDYSSYYIGTVTILTHKLKKNVGYSLTSRGPIYSGDFIKIAIKILGEKRVHLFQSSQEGSSFRVLLLGTKDGTIAIAPRVPEENTFTLLQESEEIKFLGNYLRGTTTLFRRAIIFESI